MARFSGHPAPAGLSPAIAAASTHLGSETSPDAELCRLFDLWAVNMRQHEALFERLDNEDGSEEVDAEVQAAFEALRDASNEIDAAIAATPARTVAGLAVKARILGRYNPPDLDKVGRSLLADILAMDRGARA